MGPGTTSPGLLSALTAQPKAWWNQLKPGRRAVITVSLEGTSLRVTASKGKKILAWANLPFNPQLVTDDLVNNPAELANVLRNALKRLEYRPSSVLAVYPGVRSVSRIIPIPKAHDVSPATVLTQEARRILGAAPDQNYLYWKRVAQDQTTEQYYVLAIPRVRMDAFVRTMVEAGLTPKTVDLKALALSRAVGGPAGAIINLEHTFMTIVIFSGYVPQVANTIVLEEAASMDEQETMDRLVDELQRSIAYYQERNPTGAPLPIFLSGGNPLLDTDALPQAIQRVFNTSPSTLSVPFQYPQEFPVSMFLSNLGVLVR